MLMKAFVTGTNHEVKPFEALKAFTKLSRQDKIYYAQQTHNALVHFNELTMILLLLFYAPRCLELGNGWVDILLQAEAFVRGTGGLTRLGCLFRSPRLDGLNFSCTLFT